ncbi:DASS family sodium-coupled anion symporter [Microbaculum marinum]|uniref:DASS family sodium-coupled anion symporter n=1 Tax=Microbaculum marinum TaxID=1764581 RepID=A0AAW9RR68_9HYPH
MTDEPHADSRSSATQAARRVGLLAGPALAVAMGAAGSPPDLDPAAWNAAAVAILMAVWWMTEAVPLPVTALLPLVLFPLLGVTSIEETAASYANPLIFLFLGGFIIARAMARWQLHRRLAWQVLRVGGSGPTAVVAGVMAVTAFLSMWVSNTATAMVMLPIGQSLAASFAERPDVSRAQDTAFSSALLLGIAYAATIGGMGTLIGTPPNALFAGFLHESYGIEIGFADWMLIGIPIVAVLLPLAWMILTRIAFQVPRLAGHSQESLAGPADPPGPMSREERMVAAIMVLVAACWLLRPVIEAVVPGLPVSDAGIAIAGAILMFALPVRLARPGFLLDWSDMKELRWDVLILFGGGLALAAAISGTGLSTWIGALVVDLEALPTWLMILLVMAIVVYLGELASNTAMAAVFLPVAGAAAVAMGDSPLMLALPVALAASLGFMLPVATPPNAIVFGSGSVGMPQMLRAGAILDVVAIIAVAALALTLGQAMFPG